MNQFVNLYFIGCVFNVNLLGLYLYRNYFKIDRGYLVNLKKIGLFVDPFTGQVTDRPTSSQRKVFMGAFILFSSWLFTLTQIFSLFVYAIQKSRIEEGEISAVQKIDMELENVHLSPEVVIAYTIQRSSLILDREIDESFLTIEFESLKQRKISFDEHQVRHVLGIDNTPHLSLAA